MAYRVSEGLHLEQSRQQRQFLELPVIPHTMLFINASSSATSGDLRTLIEYCLGREDLSDYTFYWDVRALNDLDGIPSQLIEEGRICVVAHDAYEYRRALATCEYILTTNLLPYQYVKRPGQHLVYLPTEGLYWSELLANRRFLQGLTPLLDATDLLVSPSDLMTEFLLAHRCPASTQVMRLLNTPHPRGDSSVHTNGCKVVVSLPAKAFNKRWGENPDRLFEWARQTTSTLNLRPEELCLMVPGQAMDWMYDGYVRVPIRLVTFAEGLFARLEGAQILITASMFDLAVGLERGITCILVHRENEVYEDIVCFEPFDKPYYSVTSLAEAVELARQVLPSLPPEGCPHHPDDASRASCKAIVDAMLTDKGTSILPGQGNHDLLIAPWNDGAGFREFQHLGLNKHAGTLLLMGDEHFRILDDERIHYAGACLTYRAGFHSGDDRERELILANEDDELYEAIKDNPGNFMALEWIRMLGNVHFDTILAPLQLNCFWRVMLRVAPADRIEFYDQLCDLNVQEEDPVPASQ